MQGEQGETQRMAKLCQELCVNSYLHIQDLAFTEFIQANAASLAITSNVAKVVVNSGSSSRTCISR